jgi:hypothetical protein
VAMSMTTSSIPKGPVSHPDRRGGDRVPQSEIDLEDPYDIIDFEENDADKDG